jgi:hypothetical protein
MTEPNKENDMICTGGIPPQMVMGMELYQMYMKATMNYWQLYAALTGLDQWAAAVNTAEDTE